MGPLRQGDLRTLLQCLRGFYIQLDLETFATQVLSLLPQVVSVEMIGYNELNPQTNHQVRLVKPPEANPPGSEQVLAQYLHEHPLIDYRRQTRDGQAHKISDFLTLRQFHRLALYNDLYRGIGVEHQMGITFPSPPPLLMGIAFSRNRLDFSERDRLLLNLLRPHLIQAHHNARAITQVQQEVARLGLALEKSDRGVILLNPEGRVRLMTERARRWMEEYFGKLPLPTRTCLPEEVWRWVQGQHALLAQEDKVPLPRFPLIVEREGKQLVVRLFASPSEDQHLLLMEEQQTALTAASLMSLGLGQREAEVLFWVTQGKTNPEVAMILGISPRTVQYHLEQIYRKLGVQTRTAAVRRALEILGLLRQ